MNSSEPRYGTRSNGLNHGDVFTSPEVVRFMLDVVGYTPESDLSNYYVLEPSFGNGDFLLEIQRRIIESANKYGFNPIEIFQKLVYGCEIDGDKFDVCITRLKENMPDLNPINFKKDDFLFVDWEVKFDFIIGNPPYVRYENIPKDIRDIYKSRFATFHYRADLYILFYEHSLKYLKSIGKHCFVCSNRWLKNEYGKKLRQLISYNYNLEKIIDIEKIDAFQESVLAYPVISVISNDINQHVVNCVCIDKIQDLERNIEYEQKKYTRADDLNAIFSSDRYSDWPTIEEQKFSIGIGVATGADRIFISRDLSDKIEAELLMPIICAKDLSGNKFQYNGLCLLNPYDKAGALVNIENYPRAKAYLEQYKAILQNRHIVKNNRKWYALIDRVKPGLQCKTKILLPDISANTHIFVDKGDYYPSHNIYYITSDNEDSERLVLLASILMSDIVKDQLMALSNKMNGGFPRWQSQVLKKLKIPYIDDIDPVSKTELLVAYERFDLMEINRLVNKLTSTKRNHLWRNYNSSIQLSLFDYSILSNC